MLIAMAGLPGSGKSTLARRIAQSIDAVILSKDEVRHVLFPESVRNYSSEQDDITMGAIFQAASWIREKMPERTVIIDGRTFSRRYQVENFIELAHSLGEPPRIIECICSDDVARARIDRESVSGTHKAGNRNSTMYDAVKQRAEPIAIPHLVLDTSSCSLEECLARAIEYLRIEGTSSELG